MALLLVLLVHAGWWAAQVQARGVAPAAALQQSSPLSPLSPLPTPPVKAELALPAVATSSPISLALVGMVLAGVLLMVGLVIWRQR